MGIGKDIFTVVAPEVAIPLRVAQVVGNVALFPFRRPVVASVLLAAGCITPSFIDGVRQEFFDVNNVTTTVEQSDGRGAITKIDLSVQPQPLVAYTADVTGTKTAINHDIQVTLFGHTTTLPSWQGNVAVTSDATVDTTINYDPKLMQAYYDPGMKNDPTDDRIIEVVPLDAFSTSVAVEPSLTPPKIDGDIRSLPQNLISEYAKTITQLRSIPGVSAVEASTDGTVQALEYTNQIRSLSNVANICTAEVTKDAVVYTAIENNIANEVMLAVGKSKDPVLLSKTIAEVQKMKVVVRIGAETDAKPRILGQKLNTTNPYTAIYKEIKKSNYITSGGDFTCLPSPAIKKILDGGATTATPSASPSSSAEGGNAS